MSKSVLERCPLRGSSLYTYIIQYAFDLYIYILHVVIICGQGFQNVVLYYSLQLNHTYIPAEYICSLQVIIDLTLFHVTYMYVENKGKLCRLGLKQVF